MDQQDIELLKKYRAIVFRSIELLTSTEISRKIFEESCSNLDAHSFEDVAEERSLLNLCGYPICGEKLATDKKWQRYLIRGKKVYDTSERRRFCSDRCYERFVFVVEQLPQEPLWFRGPSPPPDGHRHGFRLKLLEDGDDRERRGLPGREVELLPVDLIESMNRMKLRDESSSNTQEIETTSSTDVSKESKKKVRFQSGDREIADTLATGSAPLPMDDDEDDRHDLYDEEEEEPLQSHIDSEKSAVGNWEPSKKNKSKSTIIVEKKPPRRLIMIDPLPMKPSTKK